MNTVAKQGPWLIVSALVLVALASCSKSLPTGAPSTGSGLPAARFDRLGGSASMALAGQAILLLDAEADPKEFMDDHGLEEVAVLQIGSDAYRVVRQRSLTLDPALVEHLSQFRGVKHAEPNYLIEDPEGENENMAFDHADCREVGDYSDQGPISQIRLDEARDISYGEGVRIAILDTGGDDSHEAFHGLLDSTTPRFGDEGYALVGDSRESADGVDEDGDGLTDEGTGHGTHVAGIVHMVAPKAQLYSIRVLNDDGVGTLASVISGVLYAVDVRRVQVINMSLGLEARSDVLGAAVKYAISQGVQIVASAGNRGGQVPQYPASYDEVVSVTAVNDHDIVWKLANFNSAVDVSAPGVQIVSAIPGGLLRLETNYAICTGTSMAAPFVSGTVALVMSALSVPAPDAAAIVLDHTTGVDDRNPNTAGLIGTGRLDVAAAVENQHPEEQGPGDPQDPNQPVLPVGHRAPTLP